MAKQVIWSLEAEIDLTKILEFYFYKDFAKTYAKRLNEIFEKEIEQISHYPQIGVSCNSENVRVKIVGHYQIIYENTDEIIYVLRIWDTRQNENRLPRGLRKK